MNAFTLAKGNSVEAIHLFFESNGGNVGDGVALYNYFRALTLDLTLYNPGSVSSIAAVAFLGAKHRKASTYATFSFHRTTWTFSQPAKAGELEPRAESLALDDRRTEAIIRAHTTIPEAKWTRLNDYDLWLSAAEAVEYGVADEIAEFSPPGGVMLFNI